MYVILTCLYQSIIRLALHFMFYLDYLTHKNPLRRRRIILQLLFILIVMKCELIQNKKRFVFSQLNDLFHLRLVAQDAEGEH